MSDTVSIEYFERDGQTVLKTTHNAGFFSCCTIRLQNIVYYFNTFKKLPDVVDSTTQFSLYKSEDRENLIPLYFKEQDTTINYTGKINLTYDCMKIQFDNYRNIDFENVIPFIKKYFEPSDRVKEWASYFEGNYKLDYENLCSVYYRGNDKCLEMKIAPYESFINKAKEIKEKNPNVKFLVQTDEAEFLEAFLIEFPDSYFFSEYPPIKKKMSTVFAQTPQEQRAGQAQCFMGITLCISRCKHTITHSGNCGLWMALYRGHTDNLHQIHNDNWY